MAQQQKIYEYLIHHCYVNEAQEIFENIRYNIRRLNNLLIVSYGTGVRAVISLAELLERFRLARKIRVDVGDWPVGQITFPKIMILMSRVMTPEIPLEMVPNSVIVVERNIDRSGEAYYALRQGKVLRLTASGDSIPHLVNLFLALRQYDFSTRISISTSLNVVARDVSMDIVMQGVIPMHCNPSHNADAQCCVIPLPQRALSTPRGPILPLLLLLGAPGHNLPPQVVQIFGSLPLCTQNAPPATTHAEAEAVQSAQRQEPRQTSEAAGSSRAKRQRH